MINVKIIFNSICKYETSIVDPMKPGLYYKWRSTLDLWPITDSGTDLVDGEVVRVPLVDSVLTEVGDRYRDVRTFVCYNGTGGTSHIPRPNTTNPGQGHVCKRPEKKNHPKVQSTANSTAFNLCLLQSSVITKNKWPKGNVSKYCEIIKHLQATENSLLKSDIGNL